MKNLRLAKETANKKKKRVEVEWRHHKAVIEPTGSQFTTKDLVQRLLEALKDILQIYQLQHFNPEEQKVFKKKKY